MDKFGVLIRVDLRLLWPKEAKDFTPWLAQNLSALGDVLGLDLELTLQESPVGPFSLDLLARDLGSDRTVVIENQIEQTNHDHLGKLLTYAAGHDASIAIWIASTFREEHRQAIDWLNQRTDTATEFFGVVLEAVKIDDSRPAYNFRLVAFPNNWRKTNISSGGKPSAKGEAYLAFFQQLIDQLRSKYNFTNARKAQAQSWYAFSSGMSGLGYSISFAHGQRIRAEAYLDRTDGQWNKWMFDQLFERRGEIELKYGAALEWERLDTKRASRIALYTQASIDDDSTALQQVLDWAVAQMLRMKQVIGPAVMEINGQADPITIPSPTNLDE